MDLRSARFYLGSANFETNLVLQVLVKMPWDMRNSVFLLLIEVSQSKLGQSFFKAIYLEHLHQYSKIGVKQSCWKLECSNEVSNYCFRLELD